MKTMKKFSNRFEIFKFMTVLSILILFIIMFEKKKIQRHRCKIRQHQKNNCRQIHQAINQKNIWEFSIDVKTRQRRFKKMKKWCNLNIDKYLNWVKMSKNESNNKLNVEGY